MWDKDNKGLFKKLSRKIKNNLQYSFFKLE